MVWKTRSDQTNHPIGWINYEIITNNRQTSRGGQRNNFRPPLVRTGVSQRWSWIVTFSVAFILSQSSIKLSDCPPGCMNCNLPNLTFIRDLWILGRERVRDFTARFLRKYLENLYPERLLSLFVSSKASSDILIAGKLVFLQIEKYSKLLPCSLLVLKHFFAKTSH